MSDDFDYSICLCGIRFRYACACPLAAHATFAEAHAALCESHAGLAVVAMHVAVELEDEAAQIENRFKQSGVHATARRMKALSALHDATVATNLYDKVDVGERFDAFADGVKSVVPARNYERPVEEITKENKALKAELLRRDSEAPEGIAS